MAKIKRLSYFICGFCLASMLFMLLPAAGGPNNYNPWADINGDGVVNIFDAILLSNAFNTHAGAGQNFTKASVLYDSGWINITDKQGQTVLVNHNLNVTDWNDPNILVDISGKMKPDGGLLRKCSASFGMPLWNETFGSPLMETGMDLARTSDGGLILAVDNGTSWSAEDFDIQLIKLDSSGKQQWNETFVSPGYDEVRQIIQTSDGGYALAGVKDYYGPGDMWLIKTDALGNVQWNQTYGGPNFENALDIIQTNDGGYALAGQTAVFHSYSDAFLVKTDADGNMQWNQTYSRGGWSSLWGVIQTSDGNYTLLGEANWMQFWLIKTNSTGNVLWDKTYGGSGEQSPRDFVQTADGGYAIAGYTTSYGAGGQDGWLIKTDADGNAQWNMTWGGPNTDNFGGVVQTADGGFALTGLTGSTGPSDGDAMLVKTDSNGNVEWSRTYGGSNQDDMRYLVLTNDGGVAMIGETQSFGAGGKDAWLIRTCLETGLEQVSASANTMTLYRGPTDPYWNYVRIRILRTR